MEPAWNDGIVDFTWWCTNCQTRKKLPTAAFQRLKTVESRLKRTGGDVRDESLKRLKKPDRR